MARPDQSTYFDTSTMILLSMFLKFNQAVDGNVNATAPKHFNHAAIALSIIAIETLPIAALAQVSSAQLPVPLWQPIIVAVIGPAAVALFGGVCAQLIVHGVQNRRRSAEQDAQDRLRDHDMKMQLIQEMSIAAAELYFALQNYWRQTVRAVKPVSEEAKAALRSELDAKYRASAIAAAAIETRLKLLFEDEAAWKFWHAARDLLQVRYFKLIDLATDELIEDNARDGGSGQWHSGLTKAELKSWDAKLLMNAYRDRIDRAVREVLKQPVARTSPEDTEKWIALRGVLPWDKQ
jgi:hypothetical protein